jgi:uncharacterized protein (UPF0332 family)
MTGYDWTEYLRLAKSLLSAIQNETGYRNAVSRCYCYYAAYWRARRILEDGGVMVPPIKSHKFVWESYDDTKDAETDDSIGELGRTLHTERLYADYDGFKEITKKRAEMAVSDAEDLIRYVAALSNSAKAARQVLYRNQ